jgi:hypothetical protein
MSPINELLPLIIGPLGALVVLSISLVVVWKQYNSERTGRAADAEKWQGKLDAERTLLQGKIDAERSARLTEAQDNARAMETWNNELHVTVKQLTALYHQGPSKGPGRT